MNVVPLTNIVNALVFAFIGMLIFIIAFVVMDKLTIWQAASHPSALKMVLVGVVIVVPFLLAYTVFAYRVFRGKARTGLYD